MDKGQDKIEQKIDALADIVANGFTSIQDQMDRRFEAVDRRFETLENKYDNKFDNIFNILDGHTKLLLENRAERAATISRFDRLEDEVAAIKKKVKLI